MQRFCARPDVPNRNPSSQERTCPMLITQTNTSILQKPNNKTPRRAFIGGALAALLSPSGRVEAQAQQNNVPSDPFIVLLKGLYQPVPVGQGPANNLGLTTVNL